MAADIASGSEARLARIPARLNHVHLIGVAGSAMAALAGMLAERGLRVTGSDNQLYEPTASLLKRLKIEVRATYDAANLAPAPDLVVVGNVVTRPNPEAASLLEDAIPYVSMPEALWHFFLRDRRVLMVAGTHGKTTSTAMMAHVLNRAGRDPSMLVGGIARDFEANYRIGAGADFVIEGDEYDTAFFDKGPKFLHYRAHGAIVTAVEFDHADIYHDLAHVQASFRALAEQMDATRVMAVCADFPYALEPTVGTAAKRITFGLRAGEYRATKIRIAEEGAHFTVERGGAALTGELLLSIGGRMNVANALGVWVLLKEFGVTDHELADGFASFRGVARRQEIVGEVNGVTLIDDFAHHPTAIRATIEAIAERFAPRRIVAAFEPRSNTARRAVFQADFATAFDRARCVYLAPVYFKENDPIPPDGRLDVAALARTIASRGPTAIACDSIAQIIERIAADARPGDVIVGMSNGPFENLHARLRDALAHRGR
jgi:UDP-N-acetylmuramate: L-alanyl-gamma-D-glutamyl-meso-diaminopimelate ligase